MELFGGKLKVPWNSMEFHGTREYGKSSMEFHGTLDLDKIPWNSMEFHGTTGVVQMLFKKFHGTLEEVPWNFLIKMSIEKDILNDILIVMSNAGNAYGIMQILIIKHQLVKEIAKRYGVFINLRKLIHPAQLNIIFIKIRKLKFHGILSHFKTQCIDDTNGSIK